MKLIITIAICLLRLQVECQGFNGPHFPFQDLLLKQFNNFGAEIVNQLSWNGPARPVNDPRFTTGNNQQINKGNDPRFNPANDPRFSTVNNQQINAVNDPRFNPANDPRFSTGNNQQINIGNDPRFNPANDPRFSAGNNQQILKQFGAQTERQNTQQSNSQDDQQRNHLYTGSNGPGVQNIPTNVNNNNPTQSFQVRTNVQETNGQVTDLNRYMTVTSTNNNVFPQTPGNDNRFPNVEPNEKPSIPTQFTGNNRPINFATQQNNAVLSPTQPESFESLQAADPNAIKSKISNAVSNFGLELIKHASRLKKGNVILSPTSIATALVLLQQAAVGVSQQQITTALKIYPDASTAIFSIIANYTKSNAHNILSMANSIFVSNNYPLNNDFKNFAIQNLGSEVRPINFAYPPTAIWEMNSWVYSKTNNKIKGMLKPGSVTLATQLVLLNAVYFKGVWQTKFKREHTKTDTFNLSNNQKKKVPFMHLQHSFKVGFDPSTRAMVAILPFEGGQYSLILILPKKADNVDLILSTLTSQQLLQYENFAENEITIEIPRFTIKTDTELNLVLRDMGVTNIFSTQPGLDNITVPPAKSPQISQAVHSGYLSIDEEGVTAAAATSFVAIALSNDDPSVTFRADRPFIAVLWQNELSLPIFISKIEDPS